MDETRADASAVIGFSGDATGAAALCFPMATAIKASSAFSGVNMTADDEDFADALGELANIVAGQAKAKLEGLNVNISLPSVIVGKQHEVLQSRTSPALVIPCDSSLGRFVVKVAMVVKKKQAAGQPEPAATGVGVG